MCRYVGQGKRHSTRGIARPNRPDLEGFTPVSPPEGRTGRWGQGLPQFMQLHVL